ncbi:Transglycosylase SLT domain-containing protein [Lutimaribacter pacificus]|uniref:Transglycosylase SLT domain-containing protein n=1 Tax=Lutimaribacter pacificus TaxID=391948 RepID=A0A1H0NGE8_9RHOB|nr:lytic transglycosylase domain-containing protein [Lutimaribacter pacificus]SDO91691.1 Transglycosylase SLT domain-containing protein [Lutimaribacter pacificus]SHK89719.1 Transglycosylase SLT domain-containing protein [Lutimaribacter pacificus]
MIASCTAPASERGGICRRILLLLLSGLLIPVTATQPLLAQTDVPEHVIAAHPYAVQIAEASQRFGIPTTWIMAVMRTESAGDLRAVSSAGAMGLMQVMPDTWAGLRIRHGLGRDPYDPRDNILAGTAYLREMWDRYGNVAAMLASYNAGPARYEEYRLADRPLPPETRAYVAALAPVLLGERPSGTGITAARPRDWREAAIFISRDDGTLATDPVSPHPTVGAAPSPVPAVPQAGITPQPEGLFVQRETGEVQP